MLRRQVWPELLQCKGVLRGVVKSLMSQDLPELLKCKGVLRGVMRLGGSEVLDQVFLVASTRLYNPLRRSIGRSVGNTLFFCVFLGRLELF